jgi:hypothetical protein
MLNRPKFTSNLSLKLNFLNRSHYLELLRVGRRLDPPTVTKPTAGPVLITRPWAHAFLYLCLLCARDANAKWHTITGRGKFIDN